MRLFVNIKELVGVQEESVLKTGVQMDELNGIKNAGFSNCDGNNAFQGGRCCI